MKKVSELRKRADRAWMKRRSYDAQLRDVYDYVMPYRDVTGLYTPNARSETDTRVDKIFDATAVKAAFRFAGRLQTELTPIFQAFMALEAGPALADGDDKKEITEELQQVGRIVHGVLSSGQYHNGAHEMYTDLYAGTGAMCILKGDLAEPVRFMVAPIAQIAIEEGPYGAIWHIYFKRSWPAADLPVMWPQGKFSQSLQTIISNNPEVEVEVCQYTYYDPAAKDWKLVVWADKSADNDEPFHRDKFRTNPWLTPRFFKVPGEAYGRGPAQIAMPFIKTTNKAQELILKAAAYALMGIWTYRRDGVFNPDTVRFEPRAMWPVASNGGQQGPSISRLPVPENFDISAMIVENERAMMKEALFDDALPPDAGAVRSATEVAERIARLSQDLSGVYGRLTLEIVVPLVQRVIDILEELGMLETSIKIDQMLTQVRVIAPIASGQQAAKVQAATNWLQIIQMLEGPDAMADYSVLEDLLPEMGRWLGVEEKFIRAMAETLKRKKERATQQQEMHAAELAKRAPQGPSPQAALMNGGGV